MAVLTVRLEKSGRILIPAAVRRRLGLKAGESEVLLNIDEQPGAIALTTRSQAVTRIQELASRYAAPDEMWSEDLLADRRREAAREWGE